MRPTPAPPLRLAAVLLPLLLLAPALHAQVAGGTEPVQTTRVDVAPRTRGGAAFTVEAAGATAGSLLGAGLALATIDCDGEDLDCVLGGVAVTGVLGAAGSVGGDLLAGRLADTRPSVGGAVGGAVLGTLGGLAVVKGLEEAGVDGAPAIVGFSVTQGLFTALGSRLFRRWGL